MESVNTSAFLSLSQNVGLWRISPDIPSTRAKCQSHSGRPPLDHALVNSKFLDVGISAVISHQFWISDHYPIVVDIKHDVKASLIWRWPSVMKLNDPVEELEPWVRTDSTYTEWATAAVKWISRNYNCKPCPKTRITAEFLPHDKCRVDPTYFRILAAQRLLALPNRNDAQNARLRRLWISLDLVWDANGGTLNHLLQSCLNAYLDLTCKKALSDWKRLSSLWTVQKRELFRYLRNLHPSKPMMLMVGEQPTVDPALMHKELSSYWASIESWPHEEMLPHVLSILEDRYAMFLPQEPYTCRAQPKRHDEAGRGFQSHCTRP